MSIAKELRLDATVIAAFVIFALLFPLSNRINFMQNDDWIYYQTVQSFLKGDFRVDPYISATFYLQGLLGAGFAALFGLQKLPILTLVMGVLSFYIFVQIVHRNFVKSKVVSLLIGGLFFLFPLNIYSIWGFMTEYYFMFFFLLSVFFIFEHLKSNKIEHLLLACLSIFLSYWVRQFAFVAYLAYAGHLFINRKAREGVIVLGFLALTLLIHFYVVPPRQAFLENSFKFERLADFEYVTTNVLAITFYLSAFVIPLSIFLLTKVTKDILRSRGRVLTAQVLFGLLAVLLYVVLLFRYFDKDVINRGNNHGEFYYYGNVLGRRGFYSWDIDGYKYHFKYFFKLYKYWEITLKVSTAMLLFASMYYVRKRHAFLPLFLGGFAVLLLISPSIYDRYLIPFFTVGLIFLASFEPVREAKASSLLTLVTVPFVAGLLFYVYNFSMDFIKLNSFVWTRAESLARYAGIDKSRIEATHAWKMLYPTASDGARYVFSYDSPVTNPLYASDYHLIGRKEIKYPLNFFINPYIYLYAKD